MLGLFATLLGPDRHDLVLVDRLEHAVSPRSLGDLMAQIDLVLAADPNLQIVATSDSPTLLDHVPAEAVRVHCLLEDGSVRIKPLTLHPDYELLRGDLRPGELWTQVGDAWVAEEPRSDAPESPPREAEALSTTGAQPGASGLRPSAKLGDTPMPSGKLGDTPTIETHHWPASMPPLPTGRQ
jgi:hypothetical protein